MGIKFINIRFLLRNRQFKIIIQTFILMFCLTVFATDVNNVVSKNNQKIIEQKAQNIEISGTITDENNFPLPGANVIEKGTLNGTQTDFDGKFSLSVTDNEAVLVISYVGYLTQEILVGSKTIITAVLQPDMAKLDEVVVIGYGSVKKSDLTGAVSSVTEKDFNNGMITSVDQLMQGRAAGVQIISTSGQPGAGASVRVRGNSSLNSSNEPLYVIDGLPINNSSPIGRVGGDFIPNNSAFTNPLNTLNPQDIKSIEVLKDASATAIYGSRGANGVVLITTKSGEEGGMKVVYDVSFGMQKMAKKLNLLDANEYVQNVGAILNEDGSSLLPETTDTSINTDWQDELFQTKFFMDGEVSGIQKHSLSVSGGSTNTKYYVGIDHLNQDGIVRSSGFKRYGTNISIEHDAKKFHISAKLNTSQLKNDYAPYGSGVNYDQGIVQTVFDLPPTVPVFNQDGSYLKPLFIDLENPYLIADEISLDETTYRTIGNMKLSYDILNSLTASVKVGSDIINSRKDVYRSSLTVTGNQYGGVANILTSERNQDYFEGLLNYNKLFGNHDISIVGGLTYEEFNNREFSGEGRSFPNDDYGVYNIGAGDRENNSIGSSFGRYRILSSLIRINHNFSDKLLTTFSLRRDGTSRFTEDKRWGLFPSASVGYRLSNEKFMKSIVFVNDLKVRLGWGQIGNQNIPTNAIFNTFNTSPFAVFNNSPVVGLEPARFSNPDLTWETTEQINAGLDFRLLKGRIEGSIDLYSKKTADLLFNKPLPLQTGFGSQWVNLENGKIVNRGVEFAISTVNTEGEFVWRSDFNLTANKNTIEDLEGNTIFAGATVSKEGEAPFSYFGFQDDGVWQIGEDPTGSAQPNAKPGYPKWIDQNEDSRIDALDRVILGNPYPDLFFSLNNTFSYKNFDLSIFIEGVQGAEMFNGFMTSTYNPINTSRNRLADPILNRWTPENPTNNWPSFSDVSFYGGSDVNSFTVEDASYIRLSNIRLSYRIKLKNSMYLSPYISGNNLAIITNYSGFDPAVNSNGSSNLRADSRSYPMARTYIVGLTASF